MQYSAEISTIELLFKSIYTCALCSEKSMLFFLAFYRGKLAALDDTHPPHTHTSFYRATPC